MINVDVSTWNLELVFLYAAEIRVGEPANKVEGKAELVTADKLCAIIIL